MFKSIQEILKDLEKYPYNVSFLSLGQTAFWSEPIKSEFTHYANGCGHSRELIAGIHDTDYFAKASTESTDNGFVIVQHSEENLDDLWVAALEFSALFGSETVIDFEKMSQYGLNTHLISKDNLESVKRMTSAWRWRGIAINNRYTISADIELKKIYPVILKAFNWAICESLDSLKEPLKSEAETRFREIQKSLEQLYQNDPEQSLTQFQKSTFDYFQELLTGQKLKNPLTSSTEKFLFNSKTCLHERFNLVEIFLNLDTRKVAIEAYNKAIANTEIYGMDRFDKGAIPFDLVIPGQGRGTICITPTKLSINTPQKIEIELDKPIESPKDLADIIEKNIGKEVSLIGKAVTLIDMLASEHILIFDHTASSYVNFTKKMNECLASKGIDLPLNPILRIHYPTWQELDQLSLPLNLESPLENTTIEENIQSNIRELELIKKNSGEKEWVQYLAQKAPEKWQQKFGEYSAVKEELSQINHQLTGIKEQKSIINNQMKSLKSKRQELETDKGKLWREKDLNENNLKLREEVSKEISQITKELRKLESKWKELDQNQNKLVNDPEFKSKHRTKKELLAAAELEKFQLIRKSIISSEGLMNSGNRPSAWWFYLLDPDGNWIQSTIENAGYYLEELI